MSVEVCFRLKCDLCSALKTAQGTYATARSQAKGWLEADTHEGILLHLCPACVKRPRPSWWPQEEGVEP